MTYDIFFHNDFDGRASAAVLVNFFKQHKDKVGRLVPVDYHLKPIWLKPDGLKRIAAKAKKGKKNPIIVVDFLYHPAAAMWFDHHPTTFLKRTWEDRFKPSETQHFAPEYASACRLVMDALVEYYAYNPPKHIHEMAEWLDVCDGGQYRSARQTIVLKEPALLLDAFINTKKNEGKTLDWLIKLLAEKGMSAALRDKRVKKEIPLLRSVRKRAVEYFKENMVVRKYVGIIDKEGLGELPTVRYAPYFLRPSLMYTIMTKRVGSKSYVFQVGVNPWKRERNPLHIGSLLMKHGGGGHKNVGAVEIKGEKAAQEFREFLVTILNNAVA